MNKKKWERRWRLWRLGAVERYYFELKDNNTYPFEDLGDGFYYILLRSDKFAFGIAIILIAIASFSLFSIVIGAFSFPLVLFFIVLGYGVFCLYGNTSQKELIINRFSGYILRIKGNEKIIVEEPISNIYIKLQRKYDTNLLPHYYLILGGYRLDDIRLTGFCMKEGPLRILGGGVAVRMGVNFYDVDNNSTMHKIYHYPNRSLLLPPENELSRFIALHQLTDEQVEEAREKEEIDEDSMQVPKAIVSHVLKNYGQPEWVSRLPGNSQERKNLTLEALILKDEKRRLAAVELANDHGRKSKFEQKDK